jgi:hypothetical protein
MVKVKKTDNLEDLSIDEKIILKQIYRKLHGRRAWIGFIWLRIRAHVGLLLTGYK